MVEGEKELGPPYACHGSAYVHTHGWAHVNTHTYACKRACIHTKMWEKKLKRNHQKQKKNHLNQMTDLLHNYIGDIFKARKKH